MKIIFLKHIFFTIFISIIFCSWGYSQISNVAITKNEDPTNEYLFLGLTIPAGGNLWIVDNDLVPVFHRVENGRIFNFTYQPNGELSYNIYPLYSYGLDSSGNSTNTFITPAGYALDVHDLQVMEDGSYYILGREIVNVDMSQYVVGGDANALFNSHTIHHMDANGNEIWRWRAYDHYDVLDVDEHIDLQQHQIDWTHCNAIEVDTDGNILLSTRNFDEITKINRQTGEIMWRLGGKRNQFQFINDSLRFMRQHDVRKRSNGNLMIFDNGHYRDPQFSSYVEYKLNEDSLTATLIRRISRNQSVYTESRGSVQELPNGHTLVSWGEYQNPAVTEFDEKDSVTYEIRFTSLTHEYRAYRFPWKTNYFSVSSDSLNFGTVSVGNSSIQEIWVKNTVHDTVTINQFYIKDSSFSVSNQLPIIILKDDSVKLVVAFTPFNRGNFHDKLNIRYVKNEFLIGQQVKLYGVSEGTVSDVENPGKPDNYSLLQNYPNPFNPVTKIEYTIPSVETQRAVSVKLKVYDILGNEVAVLVNKKQSAGSYEVEFNGEDLPSGIYFYMLSAGNFSKTEKMVLLR